MQVNNVNIQTNQCVFRKSKNKYQNYADEYLDITNKNVQKSLEVPFMYKVFGLPTLLNLSLFGFSGYCIKLSKNIKQMTKKTCLKKMGIAVGLGILGNWAATAIANKNYDKHFKKLRDYFELINDTHANLSDTTFCSFNTGAQCDVNGNIALNRFAVIDPWQRFKAKYFIKHELVHARQDEMIARSKDGIKKLNYVILRAYAKHYSKNDLVKKYINQVYNEIISDTTHKYDSAILKGKNGLETDYKGTIIGAKMLMDNPNIDINELPTVINQEHYQKVIDDMPPLTEEEEVQAEKYYEAMLDYTSFTFWKYRKYRNNLLEKEAYKENPWYTRIL